MLIQEISADLQRNRIEAEADSAYGNDLARRSRHKRSASTSWPLQATATAKRTAQRSIPSAQTTALGHHQRHARTSLSDGDVRIASTDGNPLAMWPELL